jgi:YggT family protein
MAIIGFLLDIALLIIFARVLLSWFPDIDQGNPVVRFLYDITEPILQPIRQALPQTGMIDLSPLIVVLVIYVLRAFLV